MLFWTNKKVSPVGTVNKLDLESIAKSTVIFLAAPALLYLGQLQGDLSNNQIITSFYPNLVTVGAIQGWLLGVVINFFLKFTNGSK